MLPAIDEDFAPPADSIYFHETSCEGSLDSRQGCSVESAARMHPDWQIYVLFVGPVPGKSLRAGSAKALAKYNNIKFLRLHLVDYAKGTPLQDFIRNGVLNYSLWPIAHTADALRFLSLFKWGGVYLYLDILVVKSFDILAPNCVAREDAQSLAAGALAFSRNLLGRNVAHAAIMEFKDNFRGDVLASRGSCGVMTRVLKKMCGVKYVTDMCAATCNGFEVYDPKLFYPVKYNFRSDFLKDEELPVYYSFTYHMWNEASTSHKSALNKSSAYAKLAEKYCPEVFNIYGDNFGT